MKTKVHGLFAIVMLAALTGCGGVKFSSAFSAAAQVNGGQNPTQQTNTPAAPACVLSNSDYTLDEQLQDFEIVSQTNVDFGFNLLSGLINAFGLNIQTKSGQMTMVFTLHPTLAPENVAANSTGTASMSSNSFSFNLGIWQIGVNASYFYQTPLSTLTGNTIKNGLSNLRSNFNANNSASSAAWSTHVVWADNNAGQYVIPDGSIAGIHLNDQFAFYNVQYLWQGAPCESNLITAKRTTLLPVALATVVQVDPNSAVLQITARNTDDPIALGAQVVPSSLPTPVGVNVRVLSNSVQIGNITGSSLPVQAGTPSVDLNSYLSAQTQTFLSSYNWYPRN